MEKKISLSLLKVSEMGFFQLTTYFVVPLLLTASLVIWETKKWLGISDCSLAVNLMTYIGFVSFFTFIQSDEEERRVNAMRLALFVVILVLTFYISRNFVGGNCESDQVILWNVVIGGRN